MKKKIVLLLVVVVLALLPTGCGVQRAMNMANCNFKLQEIRSVSWAGIDFLHLSINDLKDLDLATVGKCLKALASKDFTATVAFNIAAENPGKKDAEIAGMDYVVLYKGKQVMTGSSTAQNGILVAGHGGKTTIPANVKIDFAKVVTNGTLKSVDDVIDLIKDIKKVGSGEKSNFSIQICPYLTIGKKVLKVGYITLDKI